MSSKQPDARREVTLEDVEAYFVREGIHTYREVLQALDMAEAELKEAEGERDRAIAALAVSDRQHHECIDKLHALRALHEPRSPRDAGAGASRLLNEARAQAWWEGVNDQWKHRPQGARLIEFANPYRNPKKLSDWVQPQRSDDE